MNLLRHIKKELRLSWDITFEDEFFKGACFLSIITNLAYFIYMTNTELIYFIALFIIFIEYMFIIMFFTTLKLYKNLIIEPWVKYFLLFLGTFLLFLFYQKTDRILFEYYPEHFDVLVFSRIFTFSDFFLDSHILSHVYIFIIMIGMLAFLGVTAKALDNTIRVSFYKLYFKNKNIKAFGSVKLNIFMLIRKTIRTFFPLLFFSSMAFSMYSMNESSSFIKNNKDTGLYMVTYNLDFYENTVSCKYNNQEDTDRIKLMLDNKVLVAKINNSGDKIYIVEEKCK